MTSRQIVELQTHNPIERIILIPRRSDSVLYRNQIDNFTNWVNPMKPPFLPTGVYGLSGTTNPSPLWPPHINLTSATGTVVLNGQRSILQTFSILGDGNPLQEEKPAEYFTQLVPWKYLTGVPDSELLVYPFSLASPSTQPHGSINSSRIKVFQLDLNVYSLPTTSMYQYYISAYVESLNWVTISSGMGGLKYAL